MTSATVVRSTPIDPVSQGDDVAEICSLQREMLQHALSARTKLDLLSGLAGIIQRHSCTNAELIYFQRNEAGELADAVPLHADAAAKPNRQSIAQLTATAHSACRRGDVQIRKLQSLALVNVVAPVALRGQDPEAIGVAIVDANSVEFNALLVQMFAAHVVLWHVLASERDNEVCAQNSAALLDLLCKVESCPDLRTAAYTLVGELKTFLDCSRVAVGLRTTGGGACRLAAVSGLARFDQHSPFVQAIEAAMNEAALRGEVTVCRREDSQPGALAHKSFRELVPEPILISTPLRNHQDEVIGALILLSESRESLTHLARLLPAAERSIAVSLDVMRQIEGGRLARTGRLIRDLWTSTKGKVALLFGLSLLAAMAVPLPYKIDCACQIEPVNRRFVAAPFEGTLEKSFVKPGDVVRRGDLLARMDGREIRWERASVVADRQQASKERDSAQAAHNYADAQIATLEMQRLDIRLQLLDRRAENLEIRSSLDGIVTSGDLDRAEGAPLSVGQTLFEVAPLAEMVVEAAVPDEEVSRVKVDQRMLVRLDALSWETQDVPIAKLQPRSEIRDEDNVFIAEAVVDNADGRLRPGMKGRARVVTDRRLLGWILFHRPWEFITKTLLW